MGLRLTLTNSVYVADVPGNNITVFDGAPDQFPISLLELLTGQ
jgi:hypothetical protein